MRYQSTARRRAWPAVAHARDAVAFLGVAHAPHFGEVLGPGQIGAELLEHAAAGLDRGQLMGVADEDSFGPCRGGRGQQFGAAPGCRPCRPHRRRSGCAHRGAATPLRSCLRALSMVRPVSPAASRTATSTALPVGASTSTSIVAGAARRGLRSTRSDVVLPAPAGAESGWIEPRERWQWR